MDLDEVTLAIGSHQLVDLADPGKETEGLTGEGLPRRSLASGGRVLVRQGPEAAPERCRETELRRGPMSFRASRSQRRDPSSGSPIGMSIATAPSRPESRSATMPLRSSTRLIDRL